MSNSSKKGEIATILTIGTLIILSIASLVSNSLLKNKQTTKIKAEYISSQCNSNIKEGDHCGNTGDKCYVCQGRTDPSCQSDAAVGVPFECRQGDDGSKKWEYINQWGECTTICVSRATTPVPTAIPNPMCGKQCNYSQGGKCYSGNCLNSSQNCSDDNNCGWVSGCSSGMIVKNSNCNVNIPETPTPTSAVITPVNTPTPAGLPLVSLFPLPTVDNSPYGQCMARCASISTSCPECKGLEGDPRLTNGNFPKPNPPASCPGLPACPENNFYGSYQCDAGITSCSYTCISGKQLCNMPSGGAVGCCVLKGLPTAAQPTQPPAPTATAAECTGKDVSNCIVTGSCAWYGRTARGVECNKCVPLNTDPDILCPPAVIPESRDWVCDFNGRRLTNNKPFADNAPFGSASNCKQVVPKADGSGNFILQGYENHPDVAQIACSLGWVGAMVNCYIIHL